ncbi:tRNase Z NDAI_0A03170 [Naumovozyma dairenensis CBS 421]|uniref:ribonuclease Z n=1 Tax=Naumovozyma dairenensis (strain ATCC 10597 / BCRC 20456 / CBS 421 / NBRC 0211 / NRRL Y-12639) TaxID=1071378 RepID=G0W3T6_NAUDC|nr:hypothetical protein NDAI_0A03170 [Naumovozyma dairenensis CBS 421]CCD22474.1 hypothetical protein NDAI_0A03170 [Naumovozyma dairenensis CBS 421]
MFTLLPITHPTADTKHPLLLLQSDHGERYFFGKIPEGAQRVLTENRIRISKLENIFITGELNWPCLGGLPGMILTIADKGKTNLCLNYGSSLVDYIVSTWRYFVFRFGINLKTNILTNGQSYKDKFITVKSIVLSPTTISAPTNTEEVFSAKERTMLQSIISNMFPKLGPVTRYDPSSDPHLNVELPNKNFKDVRETLTSTTSYELSFNPVRGKFKVEEAIKLGVPKGPLFAKLTKGETISLENGTIVTADQVLEKERQFAKILILDIPHNDYLPSFKDCFDGYDQTDLGAIYYFLGEDVTIDSKLISFIETFNQNNNIQHFVSHSKVSRNNLTFLGSTLTTMKLKALQINNYNLPRSDSLISKEFYECFDKNIPDGVSMVQSEEDPVSAKSIPSDNVHIYCQNKSLVIQPYTKGEQDPENPLNCQVRDDSQKILNFSYKQSFDKHIKNLNFPATATYENVIENQINVNNFNNTPEKSTHVEAITLGTGSALPSKYRNVISTLLKIPYVNNNLEITNRCVLFDAGENTIGTLSRMFSQLELQTIFKDLKLIYLSHLHADHHLGIISILREWYKYNKSDPDAKIYLVTPWQYNKFVNEWLLFENDEILSRINYISNEHLVNDSFVRMETKTLTINEFDNLKATKNKAEKAQSVSPNHSPKRRKLELDKTSSYRNLQMIKQMYQELRIKSFQTCRAKHCDWAYSNSITFFMNSSSPNDSYSKTFKVSYSGDTRPNIEKFSKGVGYNSDLLIHEATLDNELIEDAIKKRHCTINEAIEVSNEMNARKLILTHFSQRYPKLPQMGNNIKVQAKEYCFAFDGMIVDYETLGDQEAVFPLLNKAFIEEKEQEDNKSETDLDTM